MEWRRKIVAIVYRATNKISGNTYIGYTGQTLKRRMDAHRYGSHKNPAIFAKAIRKYGFDAFNFEIVASFESNKEALAEERRLIAIECPAYNISAGGEGAPWTQALRDRLVPAIKASWTDERKAEWTARMKERGVSPNMIKATVAAHLSGKCSKKILLLETGEIFVGAKTIAARLGVSETAIWRACRGKLFSIKGVHIRYGEVAPSDGDRQAEIAAIDKKKRDGWHEKTSRALSRPIVDLNSGIIYDNAKAISDTIGCSSVWVHRACREEKKMGGLNLMFLDRYEGTPRAARIGPAKNSRSRPVICIDDGIVYPTATAASRAYSVNGSVINQVCRGAKSRKTAGGLRFSYAEIDKG